MAEDFYSFEKVLKELHLQEEELKRLVSEGEIRAFRDEDKMKFKKEDIERFKAHKGDDLPTLDAPAEELTEELFGEDEGSSGDVGMVTQQIEDSSFLEEDVEEIEPLEETAAPPPRGGGRGRRSAAGGRTSAVRSGTRRRAEAEEAAAEGTGMQVLLVLSAVLLLYGIFVAFNAAEVQSTGMTRGFADFVQNNFLK